MIAAAFAGAADDNNGAYEILFTQVKLLPFIKGIVMGTYELRHNVPNLERMA